MAALVTTVSIKQDYCQFIQKDYSVQYCSFMSEYDFSPGR